ncbi:MAG TPA: succinate dehydrogenase flavoprotein subunit [bacterium]|nr:succinate dehydrogenase flavoprotein subunit [bacterium]HQL63167.1 succinate dehydrogenase flavoprotein subunit [bacterium]
MTGHRYLIVGGGLAGLSAAMRLAELRADVDLFSVVSVKRSHSVCAQGGINGAVNSKGEGDSPDLHFYDTVKGGDFLADQPFCKDMCYAAPGIIYLMDRMGVPFNRTPEGHLDFRRFGGTLYNRTAFSGSTTGQQLLYALDEQVRRYEAAGKVKKYENWEFLSAVIDSKGICCGIVAVNLATMEVRAFEGAAVILATGGPGLVFGRTTNSMINTGSAASMVYQQGAKYANGEFIQIHPTAIPGTDKLRLISESARGEGGRIWVPKKKGDPRPPETIPEEDRWYFLEERYPRYGNLVPRDVASREIYDVCINLGLGLDGKAMVYLDLTHKPAQELDRKLGGILEIYEKFVGEDPRKTPMRIFPAVHYSMGGLWVGYEKTPDGLLDRRSPKNHMTNIPGLYAIGEVDCQYHGANRLGANSLLSCIFAGLVVAPAVIQFHKSVQGDFSAAAENERKRIADRLERIRKMNGKENPYRLHGELGEWMEKNVTIVRENPQLQETQIKLDALQERWKDCSALDNSTWNNQPALFLHQLWNMLELAKIIVKGALQRNECRGSHFKKQFEIKQPDNVDSPEYREYLKLWKANHDRWCKTTIATYTPTGPEITYEKVDHSLIEPHPRRYD